jgi:hypothetical protein
MNPWILGKIVSNAALWRPTNRMLGTGKLRFLGLYQGRQSVPLADRLWSPQLV